MSKIYETVIGLEVHVELATKTKIFCGCSTAFGGAPNTHTCPVCTGMPGSLPVLNRQVVEYAMAVGIATNCSITQYCKFDRKNYFYPDNPQNYQISQLYLPICRNGGVEIETAAGKKIIGIHEIHMEEDAAEAACILIEYMHGVLIQEVFHEKEQQTYIDMMEEACNFLDEKYQEKLQASYIEGLCVLLLKIKDFKRMKYWCDKSRELYPAELSTYTCYLKLYFTEGNKKHFFDELEKLKNSDIVIDRETLELIRIFS